MTRCHQWEVGVRTHAGRSGSQHAVPEPPSGRPDSQATAEVGEAMEGLAEALRQREYWGPMRR